jgi:hypothetical protein
MKAYEVGDRVRVEGYYYKISFTWRGTIIKINPKFQNECLVQLDDYLYPTWFECEDLWPEETEE